MPKDANIIGSHTTYLRKDHVLPNAIIVLWGHSDIQKHGLRSDSPCVNLGVFRLIMSLEAENVLNLEQMDIRTAFLQA